MWTRSMTYFRPLVPARVSKPRLSQLMFSIPLALGLFLAGMALAQPTGAFDRLGVDTSEHSIPLDEVMSGGPPPQGIPALGFTGDRTGAAGSSPAPTFIEQDAATWLADQEPVIVVEIGQESRIYPLQILTWHEIANDTLGGVPVSVTFCPLCNSALAFDRRVPLDEADLAKLTAVAPDTESEPLSEAFLEAYARQTGDVTTVTDGVEVTFGVSGLLYNSNLLMFDSWTGTLWSQLIGDGVVGTLTGTELLRYPAPIVSFAEARETFPDALVLSRDTGFSRNYGSNPYVGYDDANSPAFLFRGVSDGRLPPKERVITFERDGEAVAYPFTELEEARVVNDDVAGDPVVVFWHPGTASALDARTIANARDVGAATVYERTVDGRTLSFSWDGEAFRDAETGSEWSLLGEAVSGELQGARLTPVVHDNTLWFAWAAFRPETRIYQVAQ